MKNPLSSIAMLFGPLAAAAIAPLARFAPIARIAPTAVCLAFAAAGPLAHAQRPSGAPAGSGAPGGAPGCTGALSAVDAAAMVDQLVVHYGTLVPYDRNLDGRIDDTERGALATAVQQGTLRPEAAPARPAVAPPPPPDTAASRMAARYQKLAAYDGNRDGHLDAPERDRLKADLQTGKAMPCGRPGRPS